MPQARRGEITTAAGDRFTPFETWLELDGQGGLRSRIAAARKGLTLTFRQRSRGEWQELDAAAGEYVVGFIVGGSGGE
jgi:hypothetical protein